MERWRFVRLGFLLSLAHVAIWFACFMDAYKHSSRAFDHPDATMPPHAKFTEMVVDILSYPCFALWTPWMSKHMPDFVEWISFALNSAIWGFGIAAASRAIMRYRETRPTCAS